MPFTGMESVTVPGAFDGWTTLLDEYGSMPLYKLLEPAIDFAENGFRCDGEDCFGLARRSRETQRI